MSRRFINGISNLSFDGKLFSFSFDDKYQNKNGELKKIEVAQVICDLDTIEGIAKFLLKEIKEIKSMGINEITKDKNPSEINKKKGTRFKLKVLKQEHLD